MDPRPYIIPGLIGILIAAAIIATAITPAFLATPAADSPWTVENAGDTWGLSCDGVHYAANLPTYDDAINMEVMYALQYGGYCPTDPVHDWQGQTPAWSARDHSENP